MIALCHTKGNGVHVATEHAVDAKTRVGIEWPEFWLPPEEISDRDLTAFHTRQAGLRVCAGDPKSAREIAEEYGLTRQGVYKAAAIVAEQIGLKRFISTPENRAAAKERAHRTWIERHRKKKIAEAGSLAPAIYSNAQKETTQ